MGNFLDDLSNAGQAALGNIANTASKDINAGVNSTLNDLRNDIPTVDVNLGGASPPSPQNPRPSPPVAALRNLAPAAPVAPKSRIALRGHKAPTAAWTAAVLGAQQATGASGVGGANEPDLIPVIQQLQASAPPASALPASGPMGFLDSLTTGQKVAGAAALGFGALLLLRR